MICVVPFYFTVVVDVVNDLTREVAISELQSADDC